MTISWMRHKTPTLNPPDCSNSGDLKPGQDARCWVINSVQLPASYNRTAICILIFAGLGFFKQTSTGVHYMSCVLAWVFFSFPVVFSSSESRIKAAGAGTAAAGVYCSWGTQLLLCVQLCSVTMTQAVSSSSLIWGGRSRGGDLAPWAQEVPKVHLLVSGSVLNANVEESDYFRNGKQNLVHQNQEPGMTWCVTGFGQGGAKGGGLLSFTAACRENWEWQESGFEFFC